MPADRAMRDRLFSLGAMVHIAFGLPGDLSAQVADPTGRWVGGVTTEADYAAAVVHVRQGTDGLQASLTYPNQRRAGLAFDRLAVDGIRVRMEREGAEVWDGTISGNVFRGAFESGTEAGTFELLRAPEIPTASLRAFEGVYRRPDGHRIRIAHLSRVADELLSYFDEATGEDRWLVPTSDSTFVAGPTFEQPLPVERWATFRRDAQGRALLAWRRGDQPESIAHRVDLALDTIQVAAEVRAFLKERDVPGASVAIITRDGVNWADAFGFADLGSSRAAAIRTPYQIGSVTKVFTASLLLRLRDRGLLELDDPLRKWLLEGVPLPTSRRGPAEITLRHLLTHSAGLPANPVNRRDVDGVMQPYSVAELYAGLRATHLRSSPGQEWYYSNLGYALLGHVVQRVTGRPFEEALRAELLQPLGMQETVIQPTPDVAARLATHYWPEDSVRVPRPRWVFGEIGGFGGLTTTVPDLASFVAFELGSVTVSRPPLSPEAIAESQRPHYVFDGWRQAMGLGWWVRRDPQLGTVVHHGGEVDGHSSYVALSRTHDVGVIVLANLGGSTAEALGERLLGRAIEAARSSGVPTRDQAFALYLDADWADAAWALETVGAARPTDGVVWLRLGIARFQSNLFDAAEGAFEHAATLDFFPQNAMYYLARIRSLRGDANGAFDWLRRAIAGGFPASQARTAPEFEVLKPDPRWASLSGSALEPRR